MTSRCTRASQAAESESAVGRHQGEAEDDSSMAVAMRAMATAMANTNHGANPGNL